MRFSGQVYRAHNPEWSWSPTSGEGARRHGGRFNRPGVPALYTSLSPLTAIREASPFGRPMQPLTLCAYDVDAEPVLDALDPKERARIPVMDSELHCASWEQEMLSGRVPASQSLADRLIAAGWVGMRVGSFARGTTPNDINLVLWRWDDAPPCRVVVIDDDNRLPRNPLSWR